MINESDVRQRNTDRCSSGGRLHGKGGRAFDKHYANAIYSDDGGKTWIPSAPFPLGGTGESGLVELRDGTIYHNSRTHMRPGNRRIAYSHDAGETWVDEHEDDELFDGPPDVYGCKAALLKLSVNDRDVLLFSAPGNRETRTDITVWVSFDGESLAGWHSLPAGSDADWAVRDGVIVGTGSQKRLCYLVWKDEQLTDFKLKLKYRLPSGGNTGVEIHGQPDATGKRPLIGYHADIGHAGIGDAILGAWDFHFAGREEYSCNRGVRLMIDEDGKATRTEIEDPFIPADGGLFKPDRLRRPVDFRVGRG